jgi:hypothetical protein
MVTGTFSRTRRHQAADDRTYIGKITTEINVVFIAGLRYISTFAGGSVRDYSR